MIMKINYQLFIFYHSMINYITIKILIFIKILLCTAHNMLVDIFNCGTENIY